MKKSDNNEESRISKGIKYFSKLSNSKKEKLISILKSVQKVQASELNVKQKEVGIKKLIWSNQSASSKLFIGAFLGAITGLLIFGTGGLGIVGLGGGIGVWAWLATAAGGTFISSLIQNYEKKAKDEK